MNYRLIAIPPKISEAQKRAKQW